MAHTYVHPKKRTKRRAKGKKQKGKEDKRKERKTKLNSTSAQGAGRARTRLLFAGTISPVICPDDGPTQGRHKKTRRETRQEKKRKEEGSNTEIKKQHFHVQLVGQGRHKRPKGRQRRRAKNNYSGA